MTRLLRLTGSLGLFLLALALSADVRGDELVAPDGGVRMLEVVSVQVRAQDGTLTRIPRVRIAALHLLGDRERLDAYGLEQMLRWALARERARSTPAARARHAPARFGVYVGRGVFPPSARAVVRRLESAGKRVRLLFEGDVRTAEMGGLKTVIVPGGWAPSQLAGLGTEGQQALTRFVDGGGLYVGLCAGGYLPVRHIVWEGVPVTYPVGWAAGTATGPVPGRVPWPRSEVVTLTLTGGGHAAALYAGGASFDVPGAKVLARYPGGAAAIVTLRRGKGRVVLSGAHVEFRTGVDADLLAKDAWATGLQPGDAALFLRLLR